MTRYPRDVIGGQVVYEDDPEVAWAKARERAKNSGGLGSAGVGGGGSGSGAVRAEPSPFAKRAFPVRRGITYAQAMNELGDERPVCLRAMAKIRRAILTYFRAQGASLAAQITERLPDLGKAAPKARRAAERAPYIGGQADPAARAEIEAMLADLDWNTGIDVVIDQIDDAMLEVVDDAARQAIAVVGQTATRDMHNRVDERARDFARERSAELVGKRRLPDGRIIDNPNPVYSIQETTRDRVREVIADGLANNHTIGEIAAQVETILEDGMAPFTEARADLIARTEVSLANEQGKIMGLREITDYTTRDGNPLFFKKTWIVAPDEKVCEVCLANAAQGPIDIDEDFESGDDSPPGHPNCRCVLVAEDTDV